MRSKNAAEIRLQSPAQRFIKGAFLSESEVEIIAGDKRRLFIHSSSPLRLGLLFIIYPCLEAESQSYEGWKAVTVSTMAAWYVEKYTNRSGFIVVCQTAER
jgi:hypothetical protein